MGWYYNTHTGGLKDLIVELTKSWENTGEDGSRVTYKTLAKCFRGMPTHAGNLWSVAERQVIDPQGKVVQTQRFIRVDLMQCDRGCWGYKPLSEEMGPCEVNCPLSYLELAGPLPEGDKSYAVAWRERVRAHHAAKVKPVAGKWFKLKPNTSGIEKAKVTSVRPLRAVTESGYEFKLTQRLLAEQIG